MTDQISSFSVVVWHIYGNTAELLRKAVFKGFCRNNLVEHNYLQTVISEDK